MVQFRFPKNGSFRILGVRCFAVGANHNPYFAIHSLRLVELSDERGLEKLLQGISLLTNPDLIASRFRIAISHNPPAATGSIALVE